MKMTHKQPMFPNGACPKLKKKKKKYLANVLREYFYEILIPSIEWNDEWVIRNINLGTDMNSKNYSIIGCALGQVLINDEEITIENLCDELLNISYLIDAHWISAIKYLKKHPIKYPIMTV